MGEGEKLPRVILFKKSEKLGKWLGYYTGIGGDVWGFSLNYLGNLAASRRFFNLINLASILSLVLVAGGYISRKQKIYWWTIPVFVWHKLKRRKSGMTWGRVIDEETMMPIIGAKVYLLGGKLNKVIRTVVSNSLGNFEITVPENKNFRLAAKKSGYETGPLEDYSYQALQMGDIKIFLENLITPTEKVEIWTKKILGQIGNLAVTLWLLGILIWELVFWRKFGLGQVWWWVGLSWFNIVWWLKT